MIIPKSSLPPCNRFIHPHPLSYDFAVSFSRKGGVFISASLTLGMAMGLTSANKILVNVTKTEAFLELVWFCLTLVLLPFAVRRECSDQLLAGPGERGGADPNLPFSSKARNRASPADLQN